MALTGVTIRRNALHEIPEDYLKRALENNPTAWGVSIVTPEGIMINSGDECDVELIQSTCKEFNERDIIFYLCNSEVAINMEDVSPFTIVEVEEEPKLIAYVTGEYNGFKKVDSSHPTAYHLVEDYLLPKVQNLWEMLDGDMDKVIAQIEKPLFKKELMQNATSSAAITILASNGKAVTFAQGEGPSEYKWGWVSQNYGYAMAAPAAPKQEAKPKSMVGGKSTVREKAVPSTPVVNKDSAIAPPKTEGASVVKNYSIRKVKPRPTDSRKDRKIFYQRNLGYCPIGWENSVEIEVYVDPATNLSLTHQEVKRLGLESLGLTKLNNPPRAHGKDVENNHVPTPIQQPGPAVSDAVLPVMSPKSREYAKGILAREDVKKLIAENADVVSDPTKVQELEVKIADFSTQLGAKNLLDDYVRLSFAEFRKWNREDAAGFEVFSWNLRNAYASIKAKTSGKAQEKAEEHVLAKEELKPSSRSMFSGQRKTG